MLTYGQNVLAVAEHRILYKLLDRNNKQMSTIREIFYGFEAPIHLITDNG